MIAIKRNEVSAGERLDQSCFALPVGGCELTSVDWLDEKEYCCVRGEIFPVDKAAENIEFQVNLPYNWNQKTIQYGGGGFDGVLVTADDSLVGQKLQDQTPPAKGYVTFGSDGGHKEKGPWDSTWASNDEMLENFAHKQLKKTRDAAIELIKRFYGKSPQYNYFAGGSNGGREALKVAQNYPKDYDGVLCFFPVLNWVEKAVKDVENTNFMQKIGEKGLIPTETFLAFRKKVLEISGNEKGVIADYDQALQKEAEVREATAAMLTEEQKQVLDEFTRTMDLDVPFAYQVSSIPGYIPYEGGPLAEEAEELQWRQFITAPDCRDGAMSLFGDGVLRYQVLRDREPYNPMTFSVKDHYDQLAKAAQLLDATNPDLSAFRQRGGKLILVHGLADQLVTPRSSIAYYESLQKIWPQEELDTFFRFYLIPGYGHGMGEDFMMGTSIVEMLDEWVTLGQEPENFIASDQLPEHGGRTMEIYRYTNG